jgi:hypothetical protein
VWVAGLLVTRLRNDEMMILWLAGLAFAVHKERELVEAGKKARIALASSVRRFKDL